MKRAFLFPGQGAQIVGMGKDIYEKREEVRKIYDIAYDITGIDIKKICFEGPEEELNKTQNTQLGVLVTSLAILEALKAEGIDAQVATGLSLGEYGALIAANMLSLEEGIKLVQKRGEAMGTLLPEGKYAMVAVIGLENEKIEKICEEITVKGKFVVPANYNCSVQTVISGEQDAIEEAMAKLKEQGAKRVIPLNTAGPFHTPKLEQAKLEFQKELNKITFKKGSLDVIKNIDGDFYKENANIQEILANHIVSPVRFDKTIELMQEQGIEEYVEIGPGKTLTGFVRKDNKKAKVVNIYNLETLENYLKEVKS